MGRKVVSGYENRMGRIFIAGNEFCVEDWEIEEIAEEHDVTSTCDAGTENLQFGVTHLEGTINYTWDIANNPWNVPPNLRAGSTHSNCQLYVHAANGVGNQDGPFFAFDMGIQRHRNSVPVKGKVSGVITFRSLGEYSIPTGSDTSGA